MLDNATIARPYASAVFQNAQEEGNMEQWSSLLNTLSLIVQDEQMRLILSSPKISHEQLLDLITGIIGKQKSAASMNFIKVLISANRLKYVSNIYQLFEKRRAEAEGRMEINVFTAYELESDQKGKISDAMGSRLGKKIYISSVIDKSLIGGMIIKAGDSVIDASIRGRLTELHRHLTG